MEFCRRIVACALQITRKPCKKSHQNHWDSRHRNENTASVLHLLSLANEGCNAASFEIWNHQADAVMIKSLPADANMYNYKSANSTGQKHCIYKVCRWTLLLSTPPFFRLRSWFSGKPSAAWIQTQTPTGPEVGELWCGCIDMSILVIRNNLKM